MPTDRDNIRKNHAFKLQFRNHVYFFRADSEFSFARWELVIDCDVVVWIVSPYLFHWDGTDAIQAHPHCNDCYLNLLEFVCVNQK